MNDESGEQIQWEKLKLALPGRPCHQAYWRRSAQQHNERAPLTKSAQGRKRHLDVLWAVEISGFSMSNSTLYWNMFIKYSGGELFSFHYWQLHLNAILPAQLFSVEGRAVDCVEGQLRCRRQQGRGLGKQLFVTRLHGDGLDEHRVAGILVGLQFW